MLSNYDILPDFQSPEWNKLFGDSSFQYVFEGDDLANLRDLPNDVDAALDDVTASTTRMRVSQALDTVRPNQPLSPSRAPLPVPSIPPPSSAPFVLPPGPSAPIACSPPLLSSPSLPSSRPAGEKSIVTKYTVPVSTSSTPTNKLTDSQAPTSTPPPAQQKVKASPTPLRRSARLQAKREAASKLPPAMKFLSL